jgi:hypothetical protein
VRVDRGKWRQGSDKEDENKKEEEEDEGAYGSTSPSHGMIWRKRTSWQAAMRP